MIDSDYPLPDTLFPAFEFPEGNAHQAEFTRNNRWIIGTDEDFLAVPAPGTISSRLRAGRTPVTTPR